MAAKWLGPATCVLCNPCPEPVPACYCGRVAGALSTAAHLALQIALSHLPPVRSPSNGIITGAISASNQARAVKQYMVGAYTVITISDFPLVP